MLDAWAVNDFQPLVGSAFEVVLDNAETVSLTLVDVRALAPATEQRRAPFSLLFHGPAQPILAQQTLSLQHATLGTVSIFVVPLGLATNDSVTHARYEAIFT